MYLGRLAVLQRRSVRRGSANHPTTHQTPAVADAGICRRCITCTTWGLACSLPLPKEADVRRAVCNRHASRSAVEYLIRPITPCPTSAGRSTRKSAPWWTSLRPRGCRPNTSFLSLRRSRPMQAWAWQARASSIKWSNGVSNSISRPNLSTACLKTDFDLISRSAGILSDVSDRQHAKFCRDALDQRCEARERLI